MSTDQNSSYPLSGADRVHKTAPGCGRAFGILGRVALAAYFMFCVLFLSLRYAVLPNIGNYLPEIERGASHALGVPVRIDAIDASWRGLNPRLSLRDVRIGVQPDGAAAPPFHLPHVAATVSWLSIPLASLRLSSLEIDRPEVTVRRDAGGLISVAGIGLNASGRGGGLAWLLSQREILVRGGVVHWNDAGRDAAPLTLRQVDLVMHNAWQRHRVSLRAAPPQAMAAPLDLRADFRHETFSSDIADTGRWKGELYADLGNVELASWKAWFDYPFDIERGHGAVRAWVGFDHKRVHDITADLRLADVSTRLRPELDTLGLTRLDGRLAFAGLASTAATAAPATGPAAATGWHVSRSGGHRISISDFSLETGQGLVLPPTSASHTYRSAGADTPESNAVEAGALDLHTLAAFIERLPLDDSQRRLLDDYGPRGRIEGFEAQWRGVYPDIESYRVKGRFSGLSMHAQAPRPPRPKSAGRPAQAAVPGIPGFDNLSGAIDASDRGGRVDLDSRALVLHLPGYFADPVLPFESLGLRANWSFADARNYVFEVEDMRLRQAGMTVQLSARQSLPVQSMERESHERLRQKLPGALKLSAKLDNFDVSRTGRYLPLQTPVHLRDWLTGALVSGHARDVRIEIDGDMARFPFHPAPDSPPSAPPASSATSDPSGFSASSASSASSAASGSIAPSSVATRADTGASRAGDVVAGSPATAARATAAATTAQPKGRFTVSGRIDRGVLDYLPGHYGKPDAGGGKTPLWPLLEAIDGSFALDRTHLEIRAASARTHNVALSNVVATIADVATPERLLAISGKADGALQDFLGYTVASPVAGWIGHFTETAKGSGNASLDLRLDIPLAHPLESKVRGALHFAGNDVALMPLLPPLQGTVGELRFHEKGFALEGVKADFLGGPASVGGGTQADGTIAVKADGSISAEGLRRNYPGATMQKLLQKVSGETRFGVAVDVRNHRAEVVVESDMAGFGLDFPAPLDKPAVASMPLKFAMAGLPSDDPALLRDQFVVTLGSAISARYVRSKPATGDGAWRVEQGGIGVNEPAPRPDSGLTANLSMDQLDIDAWRASFGITGAKTSIVNAGTASSAPAAARPVATGATAGNAAAAGAPGRPAQESDELGLAQYIEPEVLAARATRLVVMGKRLDNVVVGASHQDDKWQANIESDQAAGYLSWNEPKNGRGMGLVTARLVSLTIPKSAAGEVSSMLDGKDATTEMPALDIVANEFELAGKKFGKLELVASNAAGAAGREWRIRRLAISNADARFTATGTWRAAAKKDNTSLDYQLDIDDAGKLLERFGFAGVLKGGKGRMDGHATWTGVPFSLDLPSLAGEVSLDMAAGQFLKVDPGAAKLLGVLSLQSLPRRLALDFRDLFSEGFAFDGVNAQAGIDRGVMTTEQFKMRSVAAAVLMSGSVDIVRESQDLHVLVLPEINVGAASVAYGLLVNPLVGLGTFLAQLFLRDPLKKAFAQEYRIGGPWTDPQVKKLARSAGPGYDIGDSASTGR